MHIRSMRVTLTYFAFRQLAKQQLATVRQKCLVSLAGSVPVEYCFFRASELLQVHHRSFFFLSFFPFAVNEATREGVTFFGERHFHLHVDDPLFLHLAKYLAEISCFSMVLRRYSPRIWDMVVGTDPLQQGLFSDSWRQISNCNLHSEEQT